MPPTSLSTWGLLLWSLGEASKGHAIIAELRSELGDAPSPSLAKILAWDASWAPVSGDFERAVSLARDAIEMARVVGIDPPLRALAVHGLGRVVLGDAAGETEVRLAIEGYLRRGEPQRAITPLLNLGGVIARRGPVPALPYVEEAKQLADRFGFEADAWSARGAILEICAEMGRFDDVMTDARPILEWAIEHQDADLRFRVLWSLAVVRIERGEPTVDLQDLADLSRRLSQEDALILAAHIELDQGDVDLARSHLIEGVANVDGTFAFKAARVCAKAGLLDLVELLSEGSLTIPQSRLQAWAR